MFVGKDLQGGLLFPDFLRADRDLSLGCKCLFVVLTKLGPDKPESWPSQRYLADLLGVSARSIHNYFTTLEKSGYLKIHDGHDGETNTYQFLPHPKILEALAAKSNRPEPSSLEKSTLPEAEKFSGGGDENFAPVFKNQEKTNTPLTPQGGDVCAHRPLARSPESKTNAIAAFERLWAAWPIKEARRRALRWFCRLWRLRSLPPIEKLLDVIKLHLVKNPRWQRGYIPFLVNWLKDQRWDDALPLGKMANTQEKSNTEENKTVYAREENKKTEQETVPQEVMQRLNDILMHWNGPSINEFELTRVRGLWKYLYLAKKLPTLDAIREAATQRHMTLLRWLHGYQQEIIATA